MHGFGHDVADRDYSGGVADLDAISYVLASRTTALPLAVGVFGARGTGKTFCLARLRRRVAEMTTVDSDAWSSSVLQVVFNARDTADRDPWPALASAVFAGVSGYVGDTDGALSRPGDGVEEARDHLADVTARIESARRDRTEALAGLATNSQSAAVLAASKDATGLWSDIQTLWRLASASRRAAYASVGVAIVAVVAVSILRPSWYATLAAVGAALAAALAVVRPWLARLHQAAAGEIALQQLLAERRAAEAEVERAERAGAAVEVAALARQWSDIDAAARSAPSVLRAQFLALADYLREAHEVRDGTDDGSSSVSKIERIIVYVDDLDRCPPAYAVTLLDTLKQLLDVPLFALVVAVDTKWLIKALNWDRSPVTDGTVTESVVLTQAYLDDIFDIGYVLSPLSPADAATLIHDLVRDGTADSSRLDGLEPAAVNLIGSSSSEYPREGIAARMEKLGSEERNILTSVAGLFETPRQVKRFTNLYRLIRAALPPAPPGTVDEQAEALALVLALAIGRHHGLAGHLFHDVLESRSSHLAGVAGAQLLEQLAQDHIDRDSRAIAEGTDHEHHAPTQWTYLLRDLDALPASAFPDSSALRLMIPPVARLCLYISDPL
jgi:hypothetical protein